MPNKIINHLPVVKDFALYFIRKAKKDLKIKRADYKTVGVEYNTRGMVYVWFHAHGAVVGSITYKADGTKRYD